MNIPPGSPKQALAQRPFRSLAHLKHTLVQVLQLRADAQLALIRAHPELAGKAMVNKHSLPSRPMSKARPA
jgi:N-carbamoyl-L-amino-acid hydrolase